MLKRSILSIIILLAAFPLFCQEPAAHGVVIEPQSTSMSIRFTAIPPKAGLFSYQISNSHTGTVLITQAFESYDKADFGAADSCLIRKTIFYDRFKPGIADTVLQFKLIAITRSGEKTVFTDSNLRLPQLQLPVIRQAKRFQLTGCTYKADGDGIDITCGFGDRMPDAEALKEAHYRVILTGEDSAILYAGPTTEMPDIEGRSFHHVIPYYSLPGNPGRTDGRITIQFSCTPNQVQYALFDNTFPFHAEIPPLYRFDEQSITISGASATEGNWNGEAAIHFKAAYHMKIPLPFINRMDDQSPLGHPPVYYFYAQLLNDTIPVYAPLRGKPGSDFKNPLGIQEYGEYVAAEPDFGGRDGTLDITVPLGGINLDPDDYHLRWQIVACDEEAREHLAAAPLHEVDVRIPIRYLFAMQIRHLDASRSSADAGKLMRRNRPVDPKYYVFLNDRRIYRSAMCQNCGFGYDASFAFLSPRIRPLQLIVYDDDVLHDDFLGRYRFNTSAGMIRRYDPLSFGQVDRCDVSLNIQPCGRIGPFQLARTENYKLNGISGVVVSGRMASCPGAPATLLVASYKGDSSLSYHIPDGVTGLQGTGIGSQEGHAIIPAANSGFSFFIPYATLSHNGLLRLRTRVEGREGNIVPDQVLPLRCNRDIRDVRYELSRPQLVSVEGHLGYVIPYHYRLPLWYGEEQVVIHLHYDTTAIAFVNVVQSKSGWVRAFNPVPQTDKLSNMIIRTGAVFIPLDEMQQTGAFKKIHLQIENDFRNHVIGQLDTVIGRPMRDLTCFQLINFEAVRKRRLLHKPGHSTMAIKIAVDGKVIVTRTFEMHEAMRVYFFFNEITNTAIIKGQKISICCYIDDGDGYQVTGSGSLQAGEIKEEGTIRLKCGRRLRRATLHYKNCSVYS